MSDGHIGPGEADPCRNRDAGTTDKRRLQPMTTAAVRAKSMSSVHAFAMLQCVPINIMLADRDLRIRYVNPASERTLKTLEPYLPCRADEIVGKSIDIFHQAPEQQRRILASDK